MSVTEYKCPCCGAPLAFSSGTQNMQCASCGNSFDIEAAKQYTEASQEGNTTSNFGWEDYGAGHEEWEDEGTMNLYTCPSCGGEIIADANTAATACPYCGNNTILQDRLRGVFRPDLLIPFKVDGVRAKKEFEKFYAGKKLLPKDFREQTRIKEITGIYVPFWLFDCDSHANMQYDATQVFTWSDRDYEYTRTDHYRLLRSGDMSFERVPVDGSQKMDNSYMEAIEPYDYQEAIDFNAAYLSGYLADKYDVDAKASEPRANERIENSTRSAFLSTTAGYASVIPHNTAVQFQNGKVRYALLPVWVVNTVYQGKNYMFAMNGQTGKFVGELPVSKGRYWAWAGGLFAGIGLVLGLIATLL